ncbi:hypothetical protein DUT90_04375 [Polaribacter sp. WD7]|uniref:hypothetical protein n=1 Tax=Polaribacter sp. WD7 TaxID=2269061 RepID=UPI000DF1A8CB|nr:hypothetical protein [Polaribacter sp. WD7]RCS27354.1 hypothetical protein DUT90_04375 [Polaribacter sp. WD7]
MKLLAVLVNYGDEQLSYLEQVVAALKRFKKYEVTVIVQSNIPLEIEGVDIVNVVVLNNYQLLPLTCRKEIWKRKDEYDVFIYGENDHLFLEKHVDKHIEYSSFLPENRIPGLIQYENDGGDFYYVGYHSHFDWDYDSVEIHNGKKFAYFSNTHQATFILTKKQLEKVGNTINFEKLIRYKPFYLYNNFANSIRKKFKKPIVEPFRYSLKCKVNTDVYDFGGMKKVICISEFEDNRIHHLPNLYIEGLKGRRKLNSDEDRMRFALQKMLKN